MSEHRAPLHSQCVVCVCACAFQGVTNPHPGTPEVAKDDLSLKEESVFCKGNADQSATQMDRQGWLRLWSRCLARKFRRPLALTAKEMLKVWPTCRAVANQG